MPARIASRAESNETGLPPGGLAGVVPVQAVEDVHQRRLPGAVLAEERMHLAAAQVEGDVVVGDGPRELLTDPPHLENELVAAARAILEKKEGGQKARPPRTRPASRGRSAPSACRR